MKILRRVFSFCRRHLCVLLCTISGSFAGILGLICGFFAGMIFEKILGSLLEEKRLASFLEAGRLENFAGQGFPGALYVSALVMFCLDDVEDSVFQLKSFLGNGCDWNLYCRCARRCKPLNNDLLVECLSAIIRRETSSSGKNVRRDLECSKKIPVSAIFRLLNSVEFLWNANSRGRRPSDYLSELLEFQCESDEIADAYRVLGLEPGDSLKKVREAHRRLAAKFHPDVNAGGDAEKNLASFVRIQTAYETIVRQLS